MGCYTSKISADTHQAGNKSSYKDAPIKGHGASTKNSLRLDPNSDANVSLKTLTFRHVMKDPLGREYFMKFLKLEHAEENLLFFEHAEVIKSTKMEDVVPQVEEMLSSFLIPGVETEVNISDTMKRNLTKLAGPDVLDHYIDFIKCLERAQNEVTMILAMGAFPRFIKHDFFHQYKVKSRELREKEEEDDVRRAERA